MADPEKLSHAAINATEFRKNLAHGVIDNALHGRQHDAGLGIGTHGVGVYAGSAL